MKNAARATLAALLFPVAILSASLAWSAEGHLAFNLLDKRDVITADISPALELRVSRVRHVKVSDFGWSVAVVKRPGTSESPNLLFGKYFHHGAHPSDIDAWISRTKFYPDDRRMGVQGVPLEIEIKVIDATTEARDGVAFFTGGSAEIGWRDLKPRPKAGKRPPSHG